MTLVILVRHAHSTANAAQILAGRREGIHLTSEGLKQARALAKRLGVFEIKTVQSSPLIRCEETIAPWLKTFSPAVRPKINFDEGLLEVDYGLWSGEKLRKLSKTPLWKTIQNTPSRVTFPQGERLVDVQSRAMCSVEDAIKNRGRGAVVIVSHGDVLKSIVASTLNLHLDEFQKIVIDPASISVLDFTKRGSRVLLLNDSQSKLPRYSFTPNNSQGLVGGGAGSSRRTK